MKLIYNKNGINNTIKKISTSKEHLKTATTILQSLKVPSDFPKTINTGDNLITLENNLIKSLNQAISKMDQAETVNLNLISTSNTSSDTKKSASGKSKASDKNSSTKKNSTQKSASGKAKTSNKKASGKKSSSSKAKVSDKKSASNTKKRNIKNKAKTNVSTSKNKKSNNKSSKANRKVFGSYTLSQLLTIYKNSAARAKLNSKANNNNKSTTTKKKKKKVGVPTHQTSASAQLIASAEKKARISKQNRIFKKYSGQATELIYNKTDIEPGRHWGSDDFCVAGDYYISSLIKKGSSKRYLIVIDKGGNVICKYKLPSNCHCNVIAYDSDKKRIICSSDDNQPPVVLKFSESSGQIVKQIEVSSSLQGTFAYNSGQYMKINNESKKIEKEPNQYNHDIPKNRYKLSYTYYSSLEDGSQQSETVRLSSVRSHVTVNGRTCYLKKQGCTCHDNRLYYVFTVRYSDDGQIAQNRIIVYDLSQRKSNGKVPRIKSIKVKVPYPGQTGNKNELEGVDFDSHGNMILMYRKKCQMYYI